MKNKSMLPLTLTALALVLAAPQFAQAKAHQTHEINRSKSGLVDNTTNGMGTWTRTVTGTKGDLTVTRTETFADGKTYSSTGTVTKSDGTVTSDMTDTGPNGKTRTVDTTVTGTGTAGDYDVSKTVTNAKGTVDTLTGTRDTTTTVYGKDTTIAMTNSSGQTDSLNVQHLTSGDATGSVTTGTGFKGQSVDRAELHTTNNPTGANGVDTTGNGQGTYTQTVNTDGGSTDVNTNRTYANGNTQNYSSDETINPDGTVTYNKANSSTNGGNNFTSSANETYTSNGANAENISGTFSQSNGSLSGTVAGTDAKNSYGYNTALTYTDSAGQTRTQNQQTLVIGDAVLNVNTGTNFQGTSNNSVGLITGQQASTVGYNHPETGSF